MKHRDKAFIYDASSVEDFKSALNSVDLVISSKMHPAVFAVSGYVPTICIAYDQKQTGFFQLLGLNDCVILISDFSEENLFNKINQVWRRREEIRNLLRKEIPLLREKVEDAIIQALKPFISAKQPCER
jgi:polysaccharide pyruvyl transferase WcaK-like protein